MKIWSIILFFVCINLAGYGLAELIASDVLYLGPEYKPFEMPYSLEKIESEFALNALIGVGAGAIAGLVGIMLKQYTFGVLAGAIFVVGSLTTLGTWVLNGLSVFLGFVLAGTGLEWVASVVQIGVLVSFFGLILEQLGNKPLT